MTKLSKTELTKNSALNTRANKALSNYFAQLTETEAEIGLSTLKFKAEPVSVDEEKKNQAQRLLRRANDIALLLTDSPVSVVRGNSGDEVNSQMAFTPDIELTPDISLNNKESTVRAETIDIDQMRDPSVSLFEALPERFQVLLCDVAGLTIAVPLVELGGIHQLSKISKLVGKPDWFKGVLTKGDAKYQCIDAARWIMPEKFSSDMAENIDYKFAIQLGKTPFILCCESVHSTIELSKCDIKWRTNDIKRPWLAGLLKEKMCALIDGARMVQVVLAQV